MDNLKAQYDRVVLIAGGLMLAAVTAYVVMGLGRLRDEFPVPSVPARGAAFEPNADLARLTAEAPRLLEPGESSWREANQRLFVSRTYLLRDGQLVDILESDTELVSGLPNDWILQHGLDYTDPNLGQADRDADGFTNLEECTAGTSPVDASSRPPLWTKLRVKAFEKIPFRMKFMGSPSTRPGDDFTPDTQFSVNTLDYTSPTQFLKVGDKIEGTELEIIKAESKIATDQMGATVDVSELTVKDSVTGDVIVLISGQTVDSPYSYALLVDTLTNNEIRVEKGKTFTFGPENSTYKLVDVDSGVALLKTLDSEGPPLRVPHMGASSETSPENGQPPEAN